MSREQVFDTEIKKFFDVCVKILESYQKSFFTLHNATDNHVLRNLQRYKIVYNMTEVSTHIPYFQKLFRTYRNELCDILKDDHWLVEENIVIQFGEELEDEELRKRSEKRKIEISAIYKYAIQLRKTTEESLKGLPDTVQEQSQELIYPDIFLLHLYRILFSIYPQNKEIQRVVQTLEKDLGVLPNISKKQNPLLENIAENAKHILGSVLPNNLKLPTNEEMSQKLEQAFKDPVVNETLGSTVNSLMNAKNLGEGIGAAIKSLENPKFMDGLLKAVQTLIPQETLDTKSTEQLKESGEIKDALGKLGIPTDIDLSKIMKEGNASELLKTISPAPLELENKDVADVPSQCNDEVCIINDPTDSPLDTKLQGLVVSKDPNDTPSSVVESKKNEDNNVNNILQSFMKTIPPELSEMFSKINLGVQSNPEPQKSLIDF
jgi:hypothetical protein